MVKLFALHSSLHFKVIASYGILRFITPWWDSHSNQKMLILCCHSAEAPSQSSFRKLSWKALHGLIPTPISRAIKHALSLPPSSHYYSCQPINQRLRSVLRGSHTGKEPCKLWVSICHLNCRCLICVYKFHINCTSVKTPWHTNTSPNVMSCRLSRNQSHSHPSSLPRPRAVHFTPLSGWTQNGRETISQKSRYMHIVWVWRKSFTWMACCKCRA